MSDLVFLISRVSADGRDAIIDALIKVVPKNKLAVELFVKVGGMLWCLMSNSIQVLVIKLGSH